MSEEIKIYLDSIYPLQYAIVAVLGAIVGAGLDLLLRKLW